MGVYGAADSTLVNMAYHSAMANVPLDQTALFAQKEENLRQFTQNISNLFEPAWKGFKQTKQKMEGLAQDTRDIIEEGGNINDYQLDQHNDTVYNFSEENLAIQKGLEFGGVDYSKLSPIEKDRARQKLELRMTKYKNQMSEQKVIFDEMVGYSADGFVYHTPGSPEANTWNAILDDYNNNGNSAKQTIEKGEIFYEFDGHKMSLKDIKKGLSKHDPDFQTEFQTKINENAKRLAEMKANNIEVKATDMNQMKEQLADGVHTMDQVRNIANMKDPNTGFTFNQVLYGQAKVSGVNGHEMINNDAIGLIYTELDKLSTTHGHGTTGGDGNSPVDMNDDGFYDATDMEMYHDPANAKLLIKKIEEDPDLYKELVINYTMETNVKNVWAQSEMEQIHAVDLEAKKNLAKQNLAVEEDRRKKQNTQNIKSQLTPKQKKMDEKFEADDKMVREALKTMDFKAMSGKKNKVVPGGNNTFKIYVGGKLVGTIDKNKMSDEDFNNTVYNYMMQKYENTRNTTFAN